MMKFKNLLIAIIISITVIHCSKTNSTLLNYKDDIYGVTVDKNKFQYVIQRNDKYVFHDLETDERLYSVDSLYSAIIEVEGKTMFIYEEKDGSAKLYGLNLKLIEEFEGSLYGLTDTSAVISKYLGPEQSEDEFDWDLYRKHSKFSLTTYPGRKRIVVKELRSRVTFDDKLCNVVLDTLGVTSIYDDSLTKIRDLEADEYIGDDGILHRHTIIDSKSFQYDEFVIDYADYKYEGLIQMEFKHLILRFKKIYDGLYCLSKNENEVILTDHKFNVIEKSEYIENAAYNIFSINGNIELGVKPQGTMEWSLPGRNDSIFAQVEVCDSVFYEQYWFDIDSLNYRIAIAENHYDSNSRASLLDEFSETYKDIPGRPLFLIEDDGFLFLDNDLNVVFHSEDALEKYAINSDSILMVLREKFTNKTYLKLYSWKE